MSTKTKVIILVVVLAVIAGGVTFAFMKRSDDKTAKKEPEKKQEVADNINPLTGLELTGDEMKRPFIVSTGNDT